MSLKIEQTINSRRTRFGLQSTMVMIITLEADDGSRMKIKCQNLDHSSGGVGLLIPIKLAPFINLSQVIDVGDSHIRDLSYRRFLVRSICPLENILSGDKFLRIGGEFIEEDD